MPLVDKPHDFTGAQFGNRYYVRLYDPPINGVTPANGEALPSTSLITLRDRDAKIAQGFTCEIQGWDELWPVLGEQIDPDLYPYARRDHILAERAAEGKGIVTEKRTRTRTIQK